MDFFYSVIEKSDEEGRDFMSCTWGFNQFYRRKKVKWEFWSEALLYVFCLIFIEEKVESWYTGTKAKMGRYES